MHSIAQLAAIAALSAVPLVTAHGYIDGVVSGGKWYSGTNPNWFYNQNSKPNTAGWYANNQDNGFVAPSAFGDADIICHKGATVGGDPVPVTAGQTIDLSWNTWPESHKGPVINYMAEVSGDFSSANKADLKFFKVSAEGLKDGSASPGKWASDDLIANNNTVSLTIPASLKPGNYVLRHEIIALHSAQQNDGAQAYPQCINLKVSGSGSASPSGVAGTALYKSSDPGIMVNIYQSLSSYTIPGPAVFSARSAKRAQVFEA